MRPNQFIEDISSQLPSVFQFLQISQGLKLKLDGSTPKEQSVQDFQESKNVDLNQSRYDLYEICLSKFPSHIPTNDEVLNPEHTRIREKNGMILTKCYKDK